LANGDSILSPWETFGEFHQLPIFSLLGLCREKSKKGGRNERKSAPCQHSKIGGKMKRKKTKRKQQGCDVLKVIDGVEQAVSTAKKVYRAVEPIVKTIVAHRRRTK
jgi:hypothetical protein